MAYKERLSNNTNTQACSCGKHKGVGEWSPYERALAYNWHRQRNKGYTDERRRYLESYEVEHGKLAEGAFLFTV